MGVGLTTDSKFVAEKHTQGEHQQGNGFERVDVGEEIWQAVVGNKGSEAPLGKKSKRQPCDGANERKGCRSTAREKARGEAQKARRKNECVETLSSDPEKGEVTKGSTDGGTKQSQCDGLNSDGFRHRLARLSARVASQWYAEERGGKQPCSLQARRFLSILLS